MAKPNVALKALGRNKEEFQVRDETSTIRTVRWQFTPSIPVHRDSGVSGWALLEVRLVISGGVISGSEVHSETTRGGGGTVKPIVRSGAHTVKLTSNRIENTQALKYE